MRISHFWAQNGPLVLNKFSLVQTIIITFIYLLALFIVQNLKKNLTADAADTLYGFKKAMKMETYQLSMQDLQNIHT